MNPTIFGSELAVLSLAKGVAWACLSFEQLAGGQDSSRSDVRNILVYVLFHPIRATHHKSSVG